MYHPDEWTQVRRQKRRQHQYQEDLREERGPWAPWNRGGPAPQDMDRAPPPSHFLGRKAYFPYPNYQPEPSWEPRAVPPGAYRRYLGPSSPSFASVVQTNLPNNNKRRKQTQANRPQTQKSNINNNNDYIQPDQNFAKLTRKLFKIIQVGHHLNNVSPAHKPRTQPKMITKMIENLTTMIKPASPNEGTSDAIYANALNWGYSTMLILESHYKNEMERLLGDFSMEEFPIWTQAFEVATKWAFKGLSRITRDTIQEVETYIARAINTYDQRNTNGQQNANDTQPENQTPPNRPTPKEPRQAKQSTTQTRTQTTNTTNTNTQEIPPTQTSVSTMTDRTSENYPTINQNTTLSPKEQRTPRARTKNSNVVDYDDLLIEAAHTDNDRTPTMVPTKTTTIQEKVSLTPIGHKKSALPKQTPNQTRVMVHQTSDPTPSKPLTTPDMFEKRTPPTNQPQPISPQIKVHRRINTTKKSFHWGLTCNNKKYLPPFYFYPKQRYLKKFN